MAGNETVWAQTDPETLQVDLPLALLLWNAGANSSAKGVAAVRHTIVSKVVETVQKLNPTPIMFFQESLSRSTVEKKWGVKKEDYHHDGRVTGATKTRSSLSTPKNGILQCCEYCDWTRYFTGDPVLDCLDMRTYAEIIQLGHHNRLVLDLFICPIKARMSRERIE